MGNCPSCGAEMGFGIAVCPNCGSQIQGDSLTDDGHHDGIGGDSSGDTIDGTDGQDTIPGDQGGTPGPEAAGPQEYEDGWVADDVAPNEPIQVDTSVPGSEIPRSHGGGFTQAGEDDPAPQDMTHVYDLDRPPDDIPDRPDSHLGLDDSGRRFPPRFFPAVGILILVVIITLAGWYLLGGDDDGNGDGNDNGEGNGEPNGNGDDPLKALHLLEGGTSGNYPYEPPGEYHVTVAVRNNGSKSVSLDDYEVSITVWIDFVSKGNKVEGLSGSIGAGETRTFDVVVQTEVLGGGDELLVGLTLRKVADATHVHTINYEQTL